MRKNFILSSLLIAVFVILASTQIIHAQSSSSAGKKFSGGSITVKPAESYSKEKQTCESGGTCNGTCSNTWQNMADLTCPKGTFTLNVYSPKGADTEYCVPQSAEAYGSIDSGKLIVNAHTQAQSTQIGICTCISAPPKCVDVTTETVSVDLSHISIFGTN